MRSLIVRGLDQEDWSRLLGPQLPTKTKRKIEKIDRIIWDYFFCATTQLSKKTTYLFICYGGARARVAVL